MQTMFVVHSRDQTADYCMQPCTYGRISLPRVPILTFFVFLFYRVVVVALCACGLDAANLAEYPEWQTDVRPGTRISCD